MHSRLLLRRCLGRLLPPAPMLDPVAVFGKCAACVRWATLLPSDSRENSGTLRFTRCPRVTSRLGFQYLRLHLPDVRSCSEIFPVFAKSGAQQRYMSRPLITNACVRASYA